MFCKFFTHVHLCSSTPNLMLPDIWVLVSVEGLVHLNHNWDQLHFKCNQLN